MRKVYKSPKQTNYRLKRAYDELRKKNKYGIRTGRIGHKRDKQRLQSYFQEVERLKRNYNVNVDAPEIFSITSSTLEFCDFVKKIQNSFLNRNSLFIDLANIKTITRDSIIILLAAMARFKQDEVNFNGSLPYRTKINEIFIESGFLKNLYSDVKIEDDSFVTFEGTKSFISRGYKLVDLKKTLPLIEVAAKHLWKEKRRIPSLYNAFGELMKNTHEHANREHPGNWHWWLSVMLLEGRNVGFSFVDFGDGIYESLFNKNDHYLEYIKLAIEKKFNKEKIMKDLLSGEIPRSGTREDHRGNGLNSIYKDYVKGEIKRIIIITNDIKIVLDGVNEIEDAIEIFENQLSGTFIYWEIGDSISSLKSL